MLYEPELDRENYKKHLLREKWRRNWLQYSNHMVKKISFGLQEPTLGRPKSIDLENNLNAKEENPASSTWHLTVQCGSSPSQSRKKHLELPNFTKYYKILHNFDPPWRLYICVHASACVCITCTYLFVFIPIDDRKALNSNKF